MSAFNKINQFSEDLHTGKHDFTTDVLKVALTNTEPNANTAATISDLTELAAGNGYTAGGATIPNVTATETDGITSVKGDKVTFSATGSFGPFRYAVINNSTANALVGFYDYGSSITMANGESFEVKFSNLDTAGTIFTHS